MSLGAVGYYSALFSFLFLAFLSLLSWKRTFNVSGILFFAALLCTAAWAYVAATQDRFADLPTPVLVYFEVLRNIVWLAFLYSLSPVRKIHSRALRVFSVLFTLALGVAIVYARHAPDIYVFLLGHFSSLMLVALGFVSYAIIGLIAMEQLFRNTDVDSRWAIKFLIIGLGLMFAFDLFFYSNTLLVTQLDIRIWDARGYAYTILAPLLAISAARNKNWSFDVFVSRTVVFHTGIIIIIGAYLLLMAGAGYYIKHLGGEWGQAAQIVFFILALSILLVLLSSGTFRTHAKLFISKHFFNYKYDYRREWLQITEDLSASHSVADMYTVCIKSLAGIANSNGGSLWMHQEALGFVCMAKFSARFNAEQVSEEEGFIRFLRAEQWVIDVAECQAQPGKYAGLQLPEWVSQGGVWLIIPLTVHDELTGFMTLNTPLVKAPPLNWEDRDLLNAASRQIAGMLALYKASEKLRQGDQFAAFNRLSSFVVHDLKNLVAQLGLVVRNADKHKNNPEFIEDALATVRSATGKMERLLAQLRKGRFEAQRSDLVEVAEALREVVAEHSRFTPAPALESPADAGRIKASRDRFVAVVGHLVRNAQEACTDQGWVKVTVSPTPADVTIVIEDNGHGMDAAFIRDRLFTPFETTKGNAGMGVGAYESREFIRSLGGRMEVSSTPGQGTRFTIQIPAYRGDDAHGMQATETGA